MSNKKLEPYNNDYSEMMSSPVAKTLSRDEFLSCFKKEIDDDKLWSFNKTPRTLKEAFDE